MSNDADASQPGGPVELDVSWLAPVDLGAVDALARLHLAAARRGRSLRLHGAGTGLVTLLELVGLDDVLGLCPVCTTKPGRAEGRTV
jgi:ABC-type transporter Mla MlaB component